MSEKTQCGCNGGLQLIFSCSGAADTAELADRAARKIHRSGEARMYCLAGVGGGIESIVNNTRDASHLVAIDGCDTDCTAALLRKASFTDFEHVRVTDLGFEKGQSPVADESIERVAAEIRAKIRPVNEA